MRGWRVLRDRLRALTGRHRIADEIHEELTHHEHLLAADLERQGWTPAAARREAARRLGDRARHQDDGYDVRAGGLTEAVVRDLRYSLRFLRAHPGFTVVATLTLALGIGATTAIFSVASGVLLRPLPYPDGERIAMVWMDNTRIALREDWHSYPNFVDYRDRSATFEAMAVFNQGSWTLTGDGEPERLRGVHASASLFDVLATRAALGRTFTADEEEAGAPVVVLSHAFWQRRFGGRDDVIGRTITLSARPTEIIGVMPPAFAFPAPETAFWVPTPAAPGARASRGSLWLQVIGRLHADVTVAQAQADLERVNAGILEAFPGQEGYGVYVVGYHDQLVGPVRPAILVLAGAVGFLLLIACTNVANLLLARAATRERELALRAAIGAGRGRLVRQLLTESLVLATLGGVAGVAIGFVGLRALVALAPADLPRLDGIRLDAVVLGFTALVTAVTGLLFGVAPAWHTARTDPADALREGSRGSTRAAGLTRRALVVAEVSLAVVLLVGAGLMIRSFSAMQQVDLGFATERVLTARVALLGERYEPPASRVDFFDRFVERARALPGVEGAAAIGTVFLSATPNSAGFAIEGRPDFTPDEAIEVPIDSITPGYFEVMGVPVVAGRAFDARDTSDATPVVIVNESMARRFWPDQEAVGQRIKYGDSTSQAPWMTIVGVVADTRRTGFESAIRPETYLPQSQGTEFAMTLVLRTTGDPLAALPALRGVVRELDPNVPLQTPQSMAAIVDGLTADRRLNTVLLLSFAVVAAALAAVGIYGVMAHAVEHRRRELGVRLALGASARGILSLVLAEGVGLALAGVAVGLAAAVALGRFLAALLYQTSPTDLGTFVVIAAVALVTAGLACLVPAIRALRVDPLSALRAE